MTLTTVLDRPARAGLDRVFVLFAFTLAAYFGVVYAFSFSPGMSPSRHGVHAAILLMDVLIGAELVRRRVRLRRSPRTGRGGREWVRRLWLLMAGIALAAIVLLHGDYALARYHGAEAGWTGSLVTLKIHLLAVQLACLVFLWLSNTHPLWTRAVLNRLKPTVPDVLLLSVALIPLVNYLAHNRELFSVASAAEYLAFFLLWPIAALLLLQSVQTLLGAEPIAASFVAGLAFVYYSMPFVSSMLGRPIESIFRVHVGLALFVPAAAGALYVRNRTATTRALVLAACCSVAGSAVQAALSAPGGETPTMKASASEGRSGESGVPALLSLPLKRTPDVYLLIYDGYAAGPMMAEYGVDDRSTTAFLRQSGFKIYDGAYSIYPSSRPSMSSLMDMRARPRAAIGGDNTAIAFFRAHGYTTNLILNAYLLQGAPSMAADFVYPRWSPESGLNVLYRGIGGGEFKSEIVFEDYERNEWLAAKRAVLGAATGAPRMLYAHSGFPGHSQNSGTCLPDEIARYAARLAVARTEMRDDIEAIAVIATPSSSSPAITVRT